MPALTVFWPPDAFYFAAERFVNATNNTMRPKNIIKKVFASYIPYANMGWKFKSNITRIFFMTKLVFFCVPKYLRIMLHRICMKYGSDHKYRQLKRKSHKHDKKETEPFKIIGFCVVKLLYWDHNYARLLFHFIKAHFFFVQCPLSRHLFLQRKYATTMLV